MTCGCGAARRARFERSCQRGAAAPRAQALFAPFGFICQCKIVTNRATMQSMGYGFVKYSSAAEAAAALRAIDGLSVGPKVLKVSFARPRTPLALGANLFVAGLPLVFTSEDLAALMGQFGSVVECRVLTGGCARRGDSVGAERTTTHDAHADRATGFSRGAGFARFAYRREAESAVGTLHSRVSAGRACVRGG
jgi:RNA recognition motif-containing protein